MAHLMNLIKVMFMLDLLKHRPLKNIYQMMIQVQVKLGMLLHNLHHPPSTILAFGTSVDTSSMGTRDNSTTELPHTLAANLPVFMAKLWETKDVD
jgi:hypothetical protein